MSSAGAGADVLQKYVQPGIQSYAGYLESKAQLDYRSDFLRRQIRESRGQLAQDYLGIQNEFAQKQEATATELQGTVDQSRRLMGAVGAAAGGKAAGTSVADLYGDVYRAELARRLSLQRQMELYGEQANAQLLSAKTAAYQRILGATGGPIKNPFVSALQLGITGAAAGLDAIGMVAGGGVSPTAPGAGGAPV